MIEMSEQEKLKVDVELMKMSHMEFTTEKTDGVNVVRKSSTIRGDTLKDCLEYTHILHGICGKGDE